MLGSHICIPWLSQWQAHTVFLSLSTWVFIEAIYTVFVFSVSPLLFLHVGFVLDYPEESLRGKDNLEVVLAVIYQHAKL